MRNELRFSFVDIDPNKVAVDATRVCERLSRLGKEAHRFNSVSIKHQQKYYFHRRRGEYLRRYFRQPYQRARIPLRNLCLEKTNKMGQEQIKLNETTGLEPERSVN